MANANPQQHSGKKIVGPNFQFLIGFFFYGFSHLVKYVLQRQRSPNYLW